MSQASTSPQPPLDDTLFVDRTISAAIRIGFLVLILTWCYRVLEPFLIPLLWGIIIAIGIFPLYRKLVPMLGNREKSAATAVTLFLLALLIIPSVLFTDTTVSGLQRLSQQLESGTLEVPPPPENVAGWPLIGKPLSELWRLASVNLDAAVDRIEPQLKQYAPKLLAAAAGVGLTILQFVISIIIAGALLVNAKSGEQTAHRIFKRLAGQQGEEFTDIATATIRSVVQGVLGVAVIQALLAGVGLLVFDVPAAGLWAIIVLFVAIVQLPPILILGPIAAYVFTTTETTPAVVFLIWSLLVSVSDTFLKPLFLGRGVQVPMLVILLGAIGGMMLAGIIGLFVGSVTLALGYKVFQTLLDHDVPLDSIQGQGNEKGVQNG